MRALSAIGFVISCIGLLLVTYNQLAVIPFLNDLKSTGMRSYDLPIYLTDKYEDQYNVLTITSIIIGFFSVIFCSYIYFQKRTRMTLFGTIIGFVVAVMGIIHSW